MPNKLDSPEPIGVIYLAGDIVAAYVSNNNVKSEQLPDLLQQVYTAISGLAAGDPVYGGSRDPAVPINKSVTPDYMICLEDGKKLKMLKRYLRTHYDMTPEQYRRKWGLPANYPMVAPNYAKRRSQVAKEIRLGTAANRKRPTAKKKRVARNKRAKTD